MNEAKAMSAKQRQKSDAETIWKSSKDSKYHELDPKERRNLEQLKN